MEKSLWQAEAELSRFDDDARVLKMQHERYASDLGAAKAQNTVLSHKDAFYSPEDPRADWSGMVPNQGTRKAVPGAEGGRMHIERTEEGGIVAAEDYHEQLPGGKKHYESDGRFQTEAQRQYPGHHVAGFGATGGGSSFVTRRSSSILISPPPTTTTTIPPSFLASTEGWSSLPASLARGPTTTSCKPRSPSPSVSWRRSSSSSSWSRRS